MISKLIHKKINIFLKENISPVEEVETVLKISGGSINQAWQIKTGSKNYFLKLNEAKKFPLMFNCEAKGLSLLKSAESIHVPEVLLTGNDESEQFILMEYIHPGTPEKNFYLEFGKSLAALHKNTAPRFGLYYDNYIGSLAQSNSQQQNWVSFFINERISPQLKIAVDSGAIGKPISSNANRLFKRLGEIFPVEAPALLHGDLWSGNYSCGKNSTAWIFDPAVYYGHREADIAMTCLFGGFAPDFYSGYNEAFPMEKGWEKRMDIFNLYPLLVHVNLFGGHYRYDVERILENF